MSSACRAPVFAVCTVCLRSSCTFGSRNCHLSLWVIASSTIAIGVLPPYIRKILLALSNPFDVTRVYTILSNFSSLSKTTKLILLDSLLQEVCISSVFDGSLTLSSLGLSVCLSQSQTALFRAKESPLNHPRFMYIRRVIVIPDRQPS